MHKKMISFQYFFALVSNSGAKVIIFCKMQAKYDNFFAFLPKKDEKDTKACLEYPRKCLRLRPHILEFPVQSRLFFRVQLQ